MASNPKIAKRIGSVIKLKPEKYEEYKKLHADVWPQVSVTSIIFYKKFKEIKISRCNIGLDSF